MDIDSINQLADAENLQLGTDSEYLINELNGWLATLFEMFGDVVYE